MDASGESADAQITQLKKKMFLDPGDNDKQHKLLYLISEFWSEGGFKEFLYVLFYLWVSYSM